MKATKIKYNKKDYFITTSNFDYYFKGVLTYVNGKRLIILNNNLCRSMQQRELHRLIKNKKLVKGVI